MVPLSLTLALVAASAADTVSFHFGWPQRMASSVEVRHLRSRDGQRPSEQSMRARLFTETRGDEIHVRFRDWTGPGSLDPLLEAGGRVTTVVSREGAFVRVEGIEPALQELKARMAALKGAPPDAAARIEKMAPALFAKDASENWRVLVEIWNGRSFDVGEDYVMDSDAPIPALAGEKVRIRATFRVARRLPCPDGRGGCVEARMRSEADPDDVTRVVKRLIAELGLPAAQAQQMLGEMSSVTEILLVTEPTRLVPHRLEKTRTTKVRPGPGAPEGAQAVEGKNTTKYAFAYAPAV